MIGILDYNGVVMRLEVISGLYLRIMGSTLDTRVRRPGAVVMVAGGVGWQEQQEGQQDQARERQESTRGGGGGGGGVESPV